jgi:diguanylate cyclase (GGDEF)-like protein
MFKSLIRYQYFNQTVFLFLISSVFIYLGLGVFHIKDDVAKSEREGIVLIYKLYKKIALRHDVQSYLIENEHYENMDEFINEYKKITPFVVEDDKTQRKFDLTIKRFSFEEAKELIEKKRFDFERYEYRIWHEKEDLFLLGKLSDTEYLMLSKPISILDVVSKLLYYFSLLLFFILLTFVVFVLYASFEKENYTKRKEELEKEYKRLSYDTLQIAFVDTLTGVGTRMKLAQSLQDLIETSKRFEHSFSVIMFDIDNFKIINDTYGHDYGDYILQKVAATAKNSLRASDIIARWGGEEFVIALPMSDLEVAKNLAHKIKERIENVVYEKIEKVTCSFGVVEYIQDEDEESLFKRVDTLLYQAKKAGKNCVKYEEKIC